MMLGTHVCASLADALCQSWTMRSTLQIICFALCVTHGSAIALDRTGWVYHADFLLHDAGPGHPERPQRLTAIVEHLDSDGLLARLVSIPPAAVKDEWLLAVHTNEYLEMLSQTGARPRTRLDADTIAPADSFRVARLATGGAIAAVDWVFAGRVDNAFVAARPPGHHAFPDRAAGFCLLNHVAIAARYAQSAYNIKRVLIVDWDVHHGDGTQAIFYADPSVMYFSTHQSPWYPGTGASSETGAGQSIGFNINVPRSVAAHLRALGGEPD